MLVSKCSGGQLADQQARLRYVAAAIAYTCIAVDAVLCSKYYKAVNVDGAGARLQAWQALTVVSRLCDVCAGAGTPVAVAAPAGSSRPPSRPHTCRAAGSGSTHSSSSGWPCRRRCIICVMRLFILSDAPSQRLRWAHTAVRAPCLQPFSILIMRKNKLGRVCQTTLLSQGCAQPLPLVRLLPSLSLRPFKGPVCTTPGCRVPLHVGQRIRGSCCCQCCDGGAQACTETKASSGWSPEWDPGDYPAG